MISTLALSAVLLLSQTRDVRDSRDVRDARVGAHVARPLVTYQLLPNAPSGDQLATGTLFAATGQSTTTSRAGNKMCLGANGLLVLLALNQPCVESQGLLVEVAHTNLILASQALDNASWTKQSGSAVAANDAVAPDGTTTAEKVTLTNSGGYVYQLVIGPTGSFALSFWIKRISTSGSLKIQNPSGGPGNWLVNLALLPDAWTFITASHPAVSVTSLFADSGTVSGLRFDAFGVSSIECDIWGIQFEAGPTVHSYVPTTTDAVTVPLDVVTSSASALPLASGDISLDYTPQWGGSTPNSGATLFSTFTNTTGIFIGVQSGTLGVDIETAGYNSSVLSWTAGQTYHVELKWNVGNFWLWRDGVLVLSQTDGTVPLLTAHGTFYLGGYFGVDGYEAAGHIANFRATR